MYELVLCLEYFKKNRVVHGGISEDTVFLIRGDHIKIMSFHSSKQISILKNTSKTQLLSHKNLHQDQNKSTIDPYTSDLYDVGLLLHVMLYGYPHSDKSIRVSPEKSQDAISVHGKSLLHQLLNKSKENRLTLENIKYHPWFLKTDHKLTHFNESD